MSAMDGKRDKPGPDPDRLQIDEDNWEEAVKKALEKKRLPGGWPKGEAPDDRDDADRQTPESG